MTPGLPSSPACERNKEPIRKVLEGWLQPGARVLEIGSGTGQHAVHFSKYLPGIHWQASDVGPDIDDLTRRIRLEGDDLPDPLVLDVRDRQWPQGPFEAVFSANTLHIMPADHTPLLLAGASSRLVEGGLLIIYGPFHYDGQHTSDSNRRFDQSLRQMDRRMGIRDARKVVSQAREFGLALATDVAMPANNRILIFGKVRRKA